MKPTLSEDELSDAIARWLLLERHYDGVGKQVAVTRCNGIADVLGVKLPSGEVTLFEIKRSLQDFKRDDKVFNALTGYQVAAHKLYIACEEGLIVPDQVPHPWGLLWVTTGFLFPGCQVVKKCKPVKHTDTDAVSMAVTRALIRNLSWKRFQCENEARKFFPEELA